MNHRPIVNLDNLWLSFLDVKDDIDVKDDMDISGDESINEESTWHHGVAPWEPRDVAGWSALRSSPPSAHHFAFFDWAILVRMPLHHNDGLPLALLTIHLGSIINVTCALLGCAILLYSGTLSVSFQPAITHLAIEGREGAERVLQRDGQGAPPTVIWGYVIDFYLSCESVVTY